MQAWQERKERITYNQTSGWLTKWKQQEEFKFLNEVSCVPLQQSLRHLPKNVGLKPRPLGRLYAILKQEARVVNLSKNPVAT
jgi:Probable transposase.